MTILGQAKGRAHRIAFRLIFRTSKRGDVVRIGSQYGGWWVPVRELGPDSIVYLAGAGEDISFDCGLIERFGCRVVSVDPTPRAIEYVRNNAPSQGYDFVPVGLGGTDRKERFYAPADSSHVSHSIANLQKTSRYFEADLRCLKSLMFERGHAAVDLLKVDVEGAEYEVLDHLLSEKILPRILCVEFDQPAPLQRTARYSRRLRSEGYEILKVDGYNVTFLLRQ